jgi:hypothetical protein
MRLIKNEKEIAKMMEEWEELSGDGLAHQKGFW